MTTVFNIEKVTQKRNFKIINFPQEIRNETTANILKMDLMGWTTWSRFAISAALNKGLMDL